MFFRTASTHFLRQAVAGARWLGQHTAHLSARTLACAQRFTDAGPVTAVSYGVLVGLNGPRH